MPWQQAHIHTAQAYVETLSDWLETQGACSVTYQPADHENQQDLLEPDPQATPLWDQVMVTALFTMNDDIRRLEAAAIEHFGRDGIRSFAYEILQDQAWERTWLERFQPMCFGKNLWICPTELSLPPEADTQAATVIYLDPGLAFGTGTHPTTALCLACLDGMDMTDKMVIDYGCGSGILAVAAAKLGAKKVWAIDHDAQAITATHDNAEKNSVVARIHPLHSKNINEHPLGKVDVVLANILAAPLIELAPQLAGYVKEGGVIILSGILMTQYPKIMAAYAAWFNFNPPIIEEEWVCLSAKKQR